MENKEPIHSVKGTHPVLTMLLFSVIIAGLVASGSYVSKQRSTARALETDLGSAVSLVSFGR